MLVIIMAEGGDWTRDAGTSTSSQQKEKQNMVTPIHTTPEVGNRAVAPVTSTTRTDTDSVTLDLETACWEFEVSEDRRSVRWTGTQRSLPDNGKRFTIWPCVLGSFYSAVTKSHLHTFSGNRLTGKLYPFFWTWDGNQCLRICSGSTLDL
ncbi:tripartite motif-containing protein 15-like isoform X2 [Leucoraja erinacea]|nr:tripartite motif-containing protein 15-like isoform X2 [Leucoraja erinacea]